MNTCELTENIESLTLGQRLRMAREKQDLSLDEVAKRLNIKSAWLDSMENDQFHFTPPTYLKGYLRGYTRLLNIHDEIAEWPELHNNSSYQPAISQVLSQKSFAAINKYMKWTSSLIIVLLILWVARGWHSDIVSPSNVTTTLSDNMINANTPQNVQN